jgi:hypothetical protein
VIGVLITDETSSTSSGTPPSFVLAEDLLAPPIPEVRGWLPPEPTDGHSEDEAEDPQQSSGLGPEPPALG